MFLVAGLGNPGAAYVGHRHNVGFMAAEAIVRRHAFGPFRGRFHAHMAEGTVAGTKVLVLKPLTFMNNSGHAVGEALRFFKIPLERLIVFHDELDLPLGTVRIKTGGGAAGHNGLKSLDAHVGRAYRRVRLGIGHPGHRDRVVGYVLHDFDADDHVWLEPLLEAIAVSLPHLLSGEDALFSTCLARTMQSCAPCQKQNVGAGAGGNALSAADKI